jgi:hypothetical protein
LRVGDLEELNGKAPVLCRDRKAPLLIGSVKSNMGHSESASGLFGISKVIIAMETGFIPPNLHYSCPKEGVESLVNGKLKVSVHVTGELFKASLFCNMQKELILFLIHLTILFFFMEKESAVYKVTLCFIVLSCHVDRGL